MTYQPRLSLVRTKHGGLRLDYDGQPVEGVLSIDCVDNTVESRAEVIVTFTGLAVNLETEAPNNGEN